MNIRYDLLCPPFADRVHDQCYAAATDVFDKASRESIVWRLTNMPKMSIFVATEVDDPLLASRWVGFKAGYAMTEHRYYSWLGGTLPRVRQQGVAMELMQRQHEWVAGQGYALVETHVQARNDAMVALNTKAGLVETGQFLKEEVPYLIMQRRFC